MKLGMRQGRLRGIRTVAEARRTVCPNTRVPITKSRETSICRQSWIDYQSWMDCEHPTRCCGYAWWTVVVAKLGATVFGECPFCGATWIWGQP